MYNHILTLSLSLAIQIQICEIQICTRSQAVARIADRTVSQQTLVITDAQPMKLHAVNSTSFRLLYRSTIRITPR